MVSEVVPARVIVISLIRASSWFLMTVIVVTAVCAFFDNLLQDVGSHLLETDTVIKVVKIATLLTTYTLAHFYNPWTKKDCPGGDITLPGIIFRRYKILSNIVILCALFVFISIYSVNILALCGASKNEFIRGQLTPFLGYTFNVYWTSVLGFIYLPCYTFANWRTKKELEAELKEPGKVAGDMLLRKKHSMRHYSYFLYFVNLPSIAVFSIFLCLLFIFDKFMSLGNEEKKFFSDGAVATLMVTIALMTALIDKYTVETNLKSLGEKA